VISHLHARHTGVRLDGGVWKDKKSAVTRAGSNETGRSSFFGDIAGAGGGGAGGGKDGHGTIPELLSIVSARKKKDRLRRGRGGIGRLLTSGERGPTQISAQFERVGLDQALTQLGGLIRKLAPFLSELNDGFLKVTSAIL